MKKRLDKSFKEFYTRDRMKNKKIKINPQQCRRLKLALAERMKVRRRKEDERRENYFK
ncbi:unnamed protein product [marine sediment metagenome]|uniref:Uncharacterized protein n=1 Tax=marine sediment metagenome TaxID=412755 RepID=X1DBP5_9ZZZZ